MKKVLLIAPYAYLPWRSGGQKFIAEFLEYLSRKTELTVVSVAENDASLKGNYSLLPLLKKGFSRYYDFSLPRKISALVQEKGFDCIIWEHPYFSWLAYRVRKRTGVRTLIHTHNIEHQRFRSTGRWWWPVLKWYEKNCFRKADGIFFITPEDKQFAVSVWGIAPAKCFELPFGIPIKSYPEDRAMARELIGSRHGIPADNRILLFTGAFGYKPNKDALLAILNQINPVLKKQETLLYKILICGGGLPAEMNELKSYRSENIIYTGFVPDIANYYKAADITLNPVIAGGGIKTKMVEAIAYGSTVISARTGASGIHREVCGDKLVIVNDNDWENFASNILAAASKTQTITPASYYRIYNWESIIDSLVPVAI